MRIAARAPNHLGDGVMALPALHALARHGSLVVHAPRWGAELYAEVDAHILPRGRLHADVAVLFPPSLRAALEARRCARRVGTPTDWRRWLLTDVVAARTHRRDTYAALAAAAGASATGAPTYGVRGGAASVPSGHIGLNPLSNGGTSREWPLWDVLARALTRAGHDVVFYGGPGEGERLQTFASGFPRVVGTSLPDFAATLERCAVFVSADTGPAHFARAVGRPTVVVHTSTSAERTGPAGAIGLEPVGLACHPCERPTCPWDYACQRTPVDRVLDQVRRLEAA